MGIFDGRRQAIPGEAFKIAVDRVGCRSAGMLRGIVLGDQAG